jgi:hypothetical protein
MMEGKSMMPTKTEVIWARKVSQEKIRRLYEMDARGIVDEEFIDEVGCSLYARCESIVTVTHAHYGRVKCPSCHDMVIRQRMGDPYEVLECRECGWQIVWNEYHGTYRGKQLFGANALEIFEDYIRKYPKAKSSREKMLLIDKLIHEFHTGLREYGRPVAANLIEGSLKEVIRFLDSLSYGEGYREAQCCWRQKLRSLSWVKENRFLED